MPLIGFLRRRTRIRAASTTLIAIASATLTWSTPVRADQAGISFLLPGAMGSLAAAPTTRGWHFPAIYLHSSVRGGGEVATSRAIRLGNATANLTVNLDARLKAAVDAVLPMPSSTFTESVWVGQLTLSMIAIARNHGMMNRQEQQQHARVRA